MKYFQKLKLIIQISKYFINSNFNMNQFLNERSFDTPSLTPMQKFKSDLPPSGGRLGPQSQGQTLILNINGTTNINNFHTGPTHGPSASLQNVERRQPQKRNVPNQNIQGRKGPLPEPHLKVADDQEVKKNMLPKKLLKQAKSAKNARITPKCIMQKTLKAAQMELQTGRVQQNKSQFDFNFKKRSNGTNATIEYDQKKRKSGLQQALAQNKTQNITILQQKVAPSQTKTAKSTRSMAQTKQSKSLSKRNKPEGKKMQVQTNRPKTMINNLLNTQKQRAITSAMRKTGTLTSSMEVEKENMNVQNHSKNLSISSFSSREKQGQDAIANELSKNYFLNSKQLLNHLSPTRESQIAQASTNIRGRTKSIAVTSNAPKPVQKRKNHSQSQSRSNQQQLTTTRVTKPSMTATSRQENDLDVKALKKVQAQALGNKTLAPQNKKAVDKLIKDNIRKNKHKQDEQQVKKQLEQYRQQQRKADLSQRNQEVRMINASKIINQVTGGNDLTIQAQSPVGSQRRQTSAKDTSNRRRSQSCFDYQALRKNAVNSGTSHSGSRRAHHSQENKNQYMNLQVNQPEDKNNKPISFVNEITKLTQMIEQEIGGPSSRAFNTTKTVPKVEPKKIKKSRPSIEIQRFIEKKKREDHIKKSLELTIEHDKQIKIQQNLNTLDKYVKKGKLKSKSLQGKEGSRPKSSKTKSLTRKHKRSNAQQDQTQIVGLSEIFYQNYKEDTSPFRNELRNQTPSAMDEPSIYAQTQQTYANKNSNFNSGKQSFVSTSQNYPRKTQNQSMNYQTGPPVEVPQHKKKALNKSFVPPKTRSMERPPQLEKKHPALQEISPKSNEQIRRIHEFVALYKKRCVLKPGVSDATVMGTLHSAASVIQIHFRYYKRLRDAGLVRKPRLDDTSSFINSEIEQVNQFNQVQRMDRIDISHIESAEQSDYINTTEKRRISEATVQNEDYWAPSGADQYIQAFNQRPSLDGQVIGSVFSGSGTVSGQQTLMPSPEYTKKEKKKQPANKRPSLDIELIEQSNNQYHQSVAQPSSSQRMDSQNSVQGLKTPIQVPGLDLGQLKKKQEKAKKEQQQLKQKSVYQDDQDNKIQPSPGSQDPAQTASSYSGIFNRLALPLPRSARVKVEYSLVQKDPMIKAQLREIVEHKNKRGKEIMKQGLRDKLITDRTYQKNLLKLEKWVGASYNKIDDNQASRRSKIATNEELMQEAVNGRARLQKIINVNEERQSARSGFPSNRSAKQNLGYLQYPGNGENYTERDPYKDAAAISNQNAIGSGRLHKKSKLVELINNNSSRTSSKPKRDQSSSTSLKKQVEISNSYRNDEARLEDIDLNIEDPKNDNPNVSFEERDSMNEVTIQNFLKDGTTQGPIEDRSQRSSPLDNIRQLRYGETHQQTDKSLKRSESYQTIPKDNISESIENFNQNSGYDDNQSNQGVVHPDQIELQLEDALRHEKQKISPDQSSIEALRDPSFFLRQVDEGEPSHLKDNSVTQNISEEKTKDQASNINDTTMDRERPFGNSSYMESSVTKSPQTNHKLIKVENQQYDDPHSLSDAVDDSPPRVGQKKHQNITVEIESEASVPVVPISPSSENPIGFESQIQAGAHSLSSTDSDMAKAIHAAHRDAYETPPDVISPKSIQGQILMPNEQQPQSEQDQLADQMTDYLLQQLLAEVNHDMDIMIPRTNLARQKNSIKFFEKKGIKTDLFAIEKYVDEVLEEVKINRSEFMGEINRHLSQNAQQALFQMQNSEIGTYEHFQVNLPPVLSLDLYLKLEKRRKESREHATQQSPDGRFDFEKVNDEDLQEDGVDKNFLAESQHIHNKVLFDCINDSLSQFRPHGKDGAPMAWSRLSRKLKPTEDFTLEEMFEITKHDLFRMAIMQAGTLPRREFVFGGHFDEELFAEIREKKLATLLCREIVDNEPQWLKWDFEEAQTKIDIADMVLESLVTETIGFLTQKSKEVNSAQAEFEKIEQMLKSKS